MAQHQSKSGNLYKEIVYETTKKWSSFSSVGTRSPVVFAIDEEFK